MGAVVTYGIYSEAINNKYPDYYVIGANGTAGIFGTFPTSSVTTCFFDQIVATSFFLIIICAITDERNMKVPSGLIPIAIGFTDLTLMVLAFGYNCGSPINPARDFSPRILSSLLGWGSEVYR